MKDRTEAVPPDVAAALHAPARIAAVAAAVPAFPGPDLDFDDIAALAAALFCTPVALVTVLGGQEQWFLARHGTDEVCRPAGASFCARLIAGPARAPLVVPDASKEARFSALPDVACAPHMRFYAGAPIMIDGEAVGSVCALDTKPHAEVAPDKVDRLARLAALAASLLKLKREGRLRAQAAEASLRTERRHAMALDAADVASWFWDLESGLVSGNETFYRMLGVSPARPMRARTFFKAVHPANRRATIARLREALAGTQEYDEVFRTRRTGNWLLGRGRVHERDAAGRPTLFVGVNVDVTEAEVAAERTRVLLRELNHRVKNTLAMLQSLARQTLRQTSDPVEFMEAFAGRLQSLSDAHALLSDHEWGVIHLAVLLRKQIMPYVTDYERQVEIHKDPVELGPDQAVGLGLVLHELATNASKYGALSVPGGKVVITARVVLEEGRRVLNMTWHEVGGPPVTPPGHSGFGTILIERSLDKVLGSSVHVEYLPQGVTALARLPL